MDKIIILASKSKVRKKILDKNNITNIVEPSNVDENIIKLSLLSEKASPEIISKNLAEVKANKISMKYPDKLVLGADSVIDLSGKLISKPIRNLSQSRICVKKCFFKTTLNKCEADWYKPIESKSGDDNLILRGSIYHHFPQGGLA